METILTGSGLLGSGVRRSVERDRPCLAREGPHAGRGAEQTRRTLIPSVLELLGSTDLAPFRAPLGVDEQGRVAVLDLKEDRSRHLVVEGDPREQGEALRSIAAALTQTSRPALLQVAVIDLSGNELSLLESMPHTLIENARDGATADSLLRWLAVEVRARFEEHRPWPVMLLAIHDLERTEAALGRGGRRHLAVLRRIGGGLGVHLLVGRASADGGWWRWSGSDVAHLQAQGEPGIWLLRRGWTRLRLSVACLPVPEMDRVASGLWGARVESAPARERENGPVMR